jgi:TPR repeat protein
VAIAAMVVGLQVGVDGPVVTPAASPGLPAPAGSADGVAAVAVPESAASAYLSKMQDEFWPELRRKAASGNAEAQWHYGFALMMGTFEAPDATAGLQWMEKAAAQKHGPALNSLGEVYITGDFAPRDLPKAIGYFQAAWANGEPMGMLNLGILSEYGEGRKQDIDEAVRCYRLAADKGSAAALTRLGAMYAEGDVLPKDLKQTVACYRAGAEKGSADAWCNLSEMHLRGIHVSLDKEEALACAEKAWAAGGAEGALMAADLLVELRRDYPRAMAYVTVYMAKDRSPEAGEEGERRLNAWGGELKTEADRRKFREFLDALFLGEWRRRSKEIFGR